MRINCCAVKCILCVVWLLCVHNAGMVRDARGRRRPVECRDSSIELAMLGTGHAVCCDGWCVCPLFASDVCECVPRLDSILTHNSRCNLLSHHHLQGLPYHSIATKLNSFTDIARDIALIFSEWDFPFRFFLFLSFARLRVTTCMQHTCK